MLHECRGPHAVTSSRSRIGPTMSIAMNHPLPPSVTAHRSTCAVTLMDWVQNTLVRPYEACASTLCAACAGAVAGAGK